MVIFVKIDDKNRKILFDSLKESFKETWKKIAKEFQISKAMLFYYKNGKYPIPRFLFDNLIKIGKVNIIYKEINKPQRFLKKEITLPSLNEKLAEVLGAINGDGYVSDINYEISITGSKLDKDYHQHLKEILENLFDLKFKLICQESKVRLKTYSKELAHFLNKTYDVPLGKKTGRLRIPKKLNKKKLLIAYVRGLFDTDGSIYIRRKKDIVVEIISINPNYLAEIKNVLKTLGFKAGISGKNLYIYDKKDVIKFFNLIKPANEKHLKKYRNYLNLMRQ